MPSPVQDMQELGKAAKALSAELVRMGAAATATGAILGATLARTAKLFSPAEAIRFEYRLRDLGAVVGSILNPTFVKLSDTVHKLATDLLNLDDNTKKFINTVAAWVVPITAGTMALGGLLTVLRPIGLIAGTLFTLIAKSAMGFAGAVGLGGKGKSVTSALAPTPVFIVGAAPGVMGGFGGAAGVGGTPTLVGPTSGKKSGMSTGMKVGMGLSIGGGIAGAAIAGGNDAGEDLMMAGSAALGGLLTGGPIAAVIAGGLTLLTAQFRGWMKGTGIKSADGATPKSPDGMAPRDISSFSSVLDPGRKLRMNSLATGGRPKEDSSTQQARAQATLEAINNAQNRMLAIWMELGKVQQQDAQNRIAR